MDSGSGSGSRWQSVWRRVWYNLAYYRRPPWDTGQVPPEVEEFIRTHPPGRALDVGCGSGTSSIALARAGWAVTGVDLAPRAIRLARLKAEQAGVKVNFQVGDVLFFQPDSPSYDLVLDIGCFHTLPFASRVEYLHRVERWLTAGGVWLLYAFLDEAGRRRKWLGAADLELAGFYFKLVQRQDGRDRKSEQPSAWFWFQKAISAL